MTHPAAHDDATGHNDAVPAHDAADHGAAGDHGAADHADAHGHDAGHGEEPLGPIDVAAWGAGVFGVVIGIAIAACFMLATGSA
jgi:hypothetical protein